MVASLGGVASAAPTTSARRTVTPTAISKAVRFIIYLSSCSKVSAASKVGVSARRRKTHIPSTQLLSPPSSWGIDAVAGCTTGSPGPLECPTSIGRGSKPLPCALYFLASIPPQGGIQRITQLQYLLLNHVNQVTKSC